MAQTIYATFDDTTKAEQAAGALLDFGVRNQDLSIVVNQDGTANSRIAEIGFRGGATRGAATLERDDLATSQIVDSEAGYNRTGSYDRRSYAIDPLVDTVRTENDRTVELYPETDVRSGETTFDGPTDDGTENRSDTSYDSQSDVERAAKTGISVTTGEDAAVGAAKGAGWGLGIGVLAGLAALTIPGVGLVLGGGALATAIGAAVGTTVAGAASGGVLGYFKDQGVPQHVAAEYDQTVTGGGAVIAVVAPSNGVDPRTIEELLRKYGAVNVSAY